MNPYMAMPVLGEIASPLDRALRYLEPPAEAHAEPQRRTIMRVVHADGHVTHVTRTDTTTTSWRSWRGQW